MSDFDFTPYALLFGGMRKLAPGDDAVTLELLHSLPRRDFTTIVDAGCGTGRSTLVLARALGRTIHAIDLFDGFLEQLRRDAKAAALDHLVDARCMSMADIPEHFPHVDLLWSEGAAYSIGFDNALRTWRSALAPDGILVASELYWTREDVPEEAREFFAAEYPDIRSEADLCAAAEAAGYRILGTRVLEERFWREDFYDELAPRAAALATHENENVARVARGMLHEIDVYTRTNASYGYYFLILQPT